jgi:hypothetical protein
MQATNSTQNDARMKQSWLYAAIWILALGMLLTGLVGVFTTQLTRDDSALLAAGAILTGAAWVGHSRSRG